MKKALYILFALLGYIGTSIFGQSKPVSNSDIDFININRDSIISTFNYHLKTYPDMQYRDIYKCFMQDYYGPGHLLTDTVMASNYLKHELADTKDFGGPLYEKTGFRGNFYRVNISLIKDGIIPYEEYLKAFIESANLYSLPHSEEWTRIWISLDKIMQEAGIQFNNEVDDREMIFNLLKQGNFLIHHSQNFNKYSNFHYRIIDRHKFEQMIYPYIR